VPIEQIRRPAPPPEVGECRLLGAGDISAPTDDTSPVPCRDPHTTQTLAVGRLPRSVVGRPRRPDTEAIAGYVTPRCDRRFARWIGGDQQTRILSRLHGVWFLPSDEELALGARWFRCDAMAYGVGDEPGPLPRDIEGVLSQPAALGTFGVCSDGSPEQASSLLVSCDRPRHDWRAFAAQRLPAGRRESYPDRATLRRARGACSDASREELGFPLRWRYGWQPPTPTAWATGVRHGLCWVPVRRG